VSRAEPSAQRRILVVEDEPDIAGLLELHLQDNGFDVCIASDGHEGMRQAFAREWDLVILDLRLPGPDGLSICCALRRDQRFVPILIWHCWLSRPWSSTRRSR
jgi:DNA-binding response OmpR family regulator